MVCLLDNEPFAGTGRHHRYSVEAMTDEAGSVVVEYDYDAYGKQTVVAGATPAGQFYGHTGRRHDAQTGLQYFRARYYSAELGRFVSRDPLGYVDGMSLYFGYFSPCRTDPMGTTDGIEDVVDGIGDKIEDIIDDIKDVIDNGPALPLWPWDCQDCEDNQGSVTCSKPFVKLDGSIVIRVCQCDCKGESVSDGDYKCCKERCRSRNRGSGKRYRACIRRECRSLGDYFYPDCSEVTADDCHDIPAGLSIEGDFGPPPEFEIEGGWRW